MANAAQQAVQTLTAQWYNTVVNGCGLDPNTFQLVQGAAPVGSTSEQLWNIFDAIPPLSVNQKFSGSQGNNFSTDYGGVINNLKPQNANKFEQDMGDYYADWRSYLKSSPAMPAGGILQLFKNWSDLNMPPDKAQQCYTDYQQVSQGVVPVAVQLWLNAGGGTGGRKVYNVTIDQLNNAIRSSPSATIALDSTTASSSTEHTWAKGSVQGGYSFFSASANASYDKMTIAISNAGIVVKASFDHVLSFPGAPLAQPSTDSILSRYQPWYSSSALNLAYTHNDNVVWSNTPPSWSDTFGPNGNMTRMATSLVIVDGINITMQSKVGFSTSQQTEFKAAAKAGYWPFFQAEGSGGWSSSSTFDDQGNFTVSSKLPAGNPNVLGVTVTPVASYLGGS